MGKKNLIANIRSSVYYANVHLFFNHSVSAGLDNTIASVRGLLSYSSMSPANWLTDPLDPYFT